MSNSIRTPREGVTANSKRIAQAVDDEEWQKFRVSMKGKSTRQKLDMLEQYYMDGMSRCFDASTDDIRIRVDNYVKALCRGGLLYPGCDLTVMLESNWSSNWIKRD